MRHYCVVLLLSVLSLSLPAQTKICDKALLGKTYTYGSIYGGIKLLIDKPTKDNYFSDDYFNDLLKKIVMDKKFSDKEKVQMFYLMQKKIGFAFSGVSYLPPEQNYFSNHEGKTYTYQKTQTVMKGVYNAALFLKLAEQFRTSDPILASNALLLGTLINPDSAVKKLRYFTKDNVIKEARNSNVFNHYVCLSASLVQDSIIVNNLKKNLSSFANSEWIEDVLCALYEKSNPLSELKEYIANEKNEKNGLAIQTAICILARKLPPASFEATLNAIQKAVADKWKKDIITNVLTKKYPYHYALASNTKVVTKLWDGVTLQVCPDGIFIFNATLIEFDEN